MSNLIVYRKINWKIENITRESLTRCTKNKNVSRIISINIQDNKSKWILEFYPKTDPCGFYLFKWRIDNDNISIKARLYVEKFDGSMQLLDADQGNSFEFDENEGFSFSNMFRPQDMLTENRFLKDNTLTFVIELEIQKLGSETSLRYCQDDKFLSFTDYEKIRGIENLSDVTIVCSNLEEIPAHKFVIALKCPVLMELIDNETADQGTDTIKLNDIDPKTMKALLLYLYTGFIDKNQNLSSRLLYVAEKFKLNNLKTVCISCLSDYINLQNVLETLILADHYDDKILEENCIGFIKMKFHQLKDSEDWTKLNMRQALKIMDSMERNPINIEMKNSLN
ncbi:speckle-type POZ protein-like [Chironomus tepperi]|uniref:speckle-type POZ protein-like n=1 Tax=Chironomus tepperi TaxID=113505 RepID=UPI00391EEB77